MRGEPGPGAAGASADTAEQIARATAELDRTGRNCRARRRAWTPCRTGISPARSTDLAARAPVPVAAAVAVARLPGRQVAAAVWFVAAEAVTNAVKHADATGIDIELTVETGHGQR